MANKTHCDICDITPAKAVDAKVVSRPGERYTRGRLTVTVYVSEFAGHSVSDGEPGSGSTKDVCDGCFSKLVASAYALRTHEDYNAMRDAHGALERALNAIALGGIDIETALTVARQAVGDPAAVVTEPADEIHF